MALRVIPWLNSVGLFTLAVAVGELTRLTHGSWWNFEALGRWVQRWGTLTFSWLGIQAFPVWDRIPFISLRWLDIIGWVRPFDNPYNSFYPGHPVPFVLSNLRFKPVSVFRGHAEQVSCLETSAGKPVSSTVGEYVILSGSGNANLYKFYRVVAPTSSMKRERIKLWDPISLDDCTVRLWDARSGKGFKAIRGFRQAVSSILLSDHPTTACELYVASKGEVATFDIRHPGILLDTRLDALNRFGLGEEDLNQVSLVGFVTHFGVGYMCGAFSHPSLFAAQVERIATLKLPRGLKTIGGWFLIGIGRPEPQWHASPFDRFIYAFDVNAICIITPRHLVGGQGKVLFGTSDDGNVYCRDLSPQTDGFNVVGSHVNIAFALAISPNHQEGELEVEAVVASGGMDHHIKIWDPVTHRLVEDYDMDDPAYQAASPTAGVNPRFVCSLNFNRTGTLLAAGLGDGSVKLLNRPPRNPTKARRPLRWRSMDLSTPHRHLVTQLLWLPARDGERELKLVSGSNDGELRYWRIPNSPMIKRLTVPPPYRFAVALYRKINDLVNTEGGAIAISGVARVNSDIGSFATFRFPQ
ncbi:hypothetical protein L0F63_004040 [Massospora cicadina]|nr:hypothetical protein L0F63_004040 [Massospora cicadina]